MRSMELPAGIAKGISAEARRQHLSMAVNLSGSSMEVRTKHAGWQNTAFRMNASMALARGQTQILQQGSCDFEGIKLFMMLPLIA